MIGFVLHRILHFLTFAALAMVASSQIAAAQNCSASATDIIIGSVDVLSNTSNTGSGTIEIRCGILIGLFGSIVVDIHLGEGHGGASSNIRHMISPTTTTRLDYELYQDAARQITFGGNYGSHGGAPYRLSGSNLIQLLSNKAYAVTVYAAVPGQQNSVIPGTYSSAFYRDPMDLRISYTTCNLLGILCSTKTTSTSFSVRANVVPDCNVSAEDLDFGSVGLLEQPVDASSRIDVKCTSGTSHKIGLGYGLNGSGPQDRHMKSLLGAKIRYQLYQDSNRTVHWGLPEDGSALTASGSGTAENYLVYGRVPAQPTPPPGPYSDTVTVTVTY